MCAKFRCAPLRIKQALGIFRELITTTTTTRLAFGDPPSGSKNQQEYDEYSVQCDTVLTGCRVTDVHAVGGLLTTAFTKQLLQPFTTSCHADAISHFVFWSAQRRITWTIYKPRVACLLRRLAADHAHAYLSDAAAASVPEHYYYYYYYYRTMHVELARYYYRKSSVCLPIRPSVRP